jgi:hypothetical protein
MRTVNRARPLGIAVVLLVVALATLGVAYGLWSEVLVIHSTVNTGTVHALWRTASSSDRTGSLDQNLVDYPPGTVVDMTKDVGRLGCTIDAVDPEILNFTVYNGYPSYYADCEGEWINNGTIPVNVVDLRVDTDCPGVDPVSVPFDQWVDLDLNCDGKFDINFQITNHLCSQYEPGEGEANSIKVHVKQGAPQTSALSWRAEIQLNQWNESFPPCTEE